MIELTQILAGLVVVAHCAVIFWPRKPLEVPLDENGLPRIWRNDNEKNRNVVCVWDDESGSTSAAP